MDAAAQIEIGQRVDALQVERALLGEGRGGDDEDALGVFGEFCGHEPIMPVLPAKGRKDERKNHPRPPPRPRRRLGRVRAAARLSRRRRPGVRRQRNPACRPGLRRPADSTIDGTGFMAIPGFVNVHSHPFSEPANKGLTEEYGSDKLGQSSLYEFLPVFGLDAEDAGPSTTVALSELLKSGVTTITDLSISRDGWVDDLATTRASAPSSAPMMRQGYWFTKNGHTVDYAWDEKAGEKAFEAAMKTIDRGAASIPAAAIVGDGLPVADRHLPRGLLQGGAAGGQEARHPDADARLPGGRRVPRDGASPRQDADRMARRDRRAGTRPGDRPRHLPERPSADPLSARPTTSSILRTRARRWRTARPCSRAAAWR